MPPAFPDRQRRLSSTPVLLGLVAALTLAAFLFGEPPTAKPAAQALRVLRGGLFTLALLLLIGSLLRRQLLSLPLVEGHGTSSFLDSLDRRRHDAHWLVHLRWLAAAGALGLITCAHPEARPLLLVWWAGLVAANFAFELSLRRWRGYENQILAQSIIDLFLLSGFLNASGGLENPLVTVFVLHVIVGRILLPSRKALAVTLTTTAAFGLMAFGEYFQLLPHYANSFFPHPAPLLAGSVGYGAHELAASAHAAHDLLFVLGRTVPFFAVLLVTDLFAASVMRRLRDSERDMQRAVHTAVLERERLKGVVDAAGVGMMQVDAELALRWVSGRIAGWFGWNQEALGRTCPLLDAVAGGCEICVVRSTLESGQAAAAERLETSEKQGERFFRHSSSPIRDTTGAVVQVVEVIEEITGRRALEAEAIRAGKLSVLGRMAAGIAHEIGNPLASISTRLQLLERHRDEGFVAQSVQVLREQIGRISRIVQGVSRFGRVRRRDRTEIEVNELVEEMVGVIELDARAKVIRFVLRLEEPSPRVCGVRDQVGQILLNLLLNAVEMTPAGGTVTVLSELASDEVRLVVNDDGPGIDQATRDHLFEPFFTTKPEGTGLGLSISAGFAAAHGGRIEAMNRAGGATFVLALPVHQPHQPCGRSSREANSGGTRIP